MKCGRLDAAEKERSLRILRSLVAQPSPESDPAPSLLGEALFVGNKHHAADVGLLKRLGVSAVLNCASSGIRNLPIAEYQASGIHYAYTNVQDDVSYPILHHPDLKRSEHLRTANSLYDDVRHAGGKALFFCVAGQNRSAALAIAVQLLRGLSLQSILSTCALARPFILENVGFQSQLVELAAALNDTSLAEAVSPATKRPRPGEVHPGSYETSRPSSRATSSMDLSSHIAVPCRTTRCLAAVLWFHGFGDGPEGWHREFAALAAVHPATTWIFPRAPKIRQTCYKGLLVEGWGDYLEATCTRQGSADYDNANLVDATVLKSARNMLDDVMRSGVPPSRIVVGGFSMGATAAAEIAICRNPSGSVGALIMLNGFLAVRSRAAVSSAVSSAVRSRAEVASASTLPLRALVSHGTADEQVGFDIGSEAARLLREAGVDVTLEVQRGMKHVESGFGPGKAHAAKFLDSFLSRATREADTVQVALAPAQRPPRAVVASPSSAEDEAEGLSESGAFHSAALACSHSILNADRDRVTV